MAPPCRPGRNLPCNSTAGGACAIQTPRNNAQSRYCVYKVVVIGFSPSELAVYLADYLLKQDLFRDKLQFSFRDEIKSFPLVTKQWSAGGAKGNNQGPHRTLMVSCDRRLRLLSSQQNTQCRQGQNFATL